MEYSRGVGAAGRGCGCMWLFWFVWFWAWFILMEPGEVSHKGLLDHFVSPRPDNLAPVQVQKEILCQEKGCGRPATRATRSVATQLVRYGSASWNKRHRVFFCDMHQRTFSEMFSQDYPGLGLFLPPVLLFLIVFLIGFVSRGRSDCKPKNNGSP